LIAGEPGLETPAGVDAGIVDLTEDSRQVEPGSLFLARPGGSTHGGLFIADALARGAVAVLTDHAATVPAGIAVVRSDDVIGAGARLAERFFGDPSQRLRLCAITGTNGKTTTAHLLQQILICSGTRTGLIGTVHVDDGKDTRPASLTTPGAVEISRYLARMVAHGCGACVLEASSHAIAQRRIEALEIDAAVFTNLTGDHLDYHATMDAYAAAKAGLFESLAPSATVIINADDAHADRMVCHTHAAVVECSMAAGADTMVSVCAHDLTADGWRADVRGPWGAVSGWFTLPGAHNLMNLAEALAAAHALGAPVASLDGRLHELSSPPGRLERVRSAGDAAEPCVLIDYAHTDDALAHALAAVRPMVAAGGRLWVVFGCGGDRDASKRPRMGAVAGRLADRVIITSDNPRTEDPRSIIEAIMLGVPTQARDRTVAEPDRAIAIDTAVRRANTGDVVLIAGKGHEEYQIVSDGSGGTHRRDFDDRDAARAALVRRMVEPASAA